MPKLTITVTDCYRRTDWPILNVEKLRFENVEKKINPTPSEKTLLIRFLFTAEPPRVLL